MNRKKITLRQQLLHEIAHSQKEPWSAVERILWKHQSSKNPVFKKWILKKQGTALPIIAFKESKVCSFQPASQTLYFESSGTTAEEVKSRHYFQDLDLYRASVLQGWIHFRRNAQNGRNLGGAWNLAPKNKFIALMPSAKDAPHSSLSNMLQILMNEFGDGDESWVMEGGKWQWENLSRRLRSHTPYRTAASLILFGTAFAWVHFIDWCQAKNMKFKLPSNTMLLETGGYKGRSRELSRDDLHKLLSRLLGIKLHQIFCEYSMCELSSQAYSFRKNRKLLFQFPPWCRYRVVEPLSSKEIKNKRGVLEIFDLANLDSCAFIRTEDMAIDHGLGFELLGRLPKAGLKGCSLSFE